MHPLFLILSLTFLSLFLPLYAEESLLEILNKSTFSGYAKMMYVHDDRIAPRVDQSTFGTGGKLALQTGEWRDVSLNVAYYVTDDLGLNSSNPRKTDAYMFDLNKQPYSVLGEAALKYKKGSSTFLFGRQEISTPIVSTYDFRIIPNLFEGYTYTDKSLEKTTIVFSYITKMSGLDGLVSFKHFKSMSQQTYTSLMMSDPRTVNSISGKTFDVSTVSGKQGVFMSGFKFDDGFKLQGWNYYCHDVIDEAYIDMAYPYRLSSDLVSTFELQGYAVREIGKFKDFLHGLGLNGNYELFGAKFSVKDNNRGYSAYIAYNIFTGDRETVTAFGNWGGYPEFVSVPYMFAQGKSVSAIAKSRMGKMNVKIDLPKFKGVEHSCNLGYSRIDLDDDIMPNGDIDVVSFIYRAKLSDPLGLKVQYEIRESENSRYANDIVTLAATYHF